MKEHNQIWSQIPEHPYRILILGGPDQKKQIYYSI